MGEHEEEEEEEEKEEGGGGGGRDRLSEGGWAMEGAAMRITAAPHQEQRISALLVLAWRLSHAAGRECLLRGKAVIMNVRGADGSSPIGGPVMPGGQQVQPQRCTAAP